MTTTPLPRWIVRGGPDTPFRLLTWEDFMSELLAQEVRARHIRLTPSSKHNPLARKGWEVVAEFRSLRSKRAAETRNRRRRKIRYIQPELPLSSE